MSYTIPLDPPVRISIACSDPKWGRVYAVATNKGWVEIRVTPSGLLRVSEPQKGYHPVFAPASGETQ